MSHDSGPDEHNGGGTSWLRQVGQSLAGPLRDRDELIAALSEARNNGLLDADALWMMHGVLRVSELQVRDVMVPRSQMVVLEHAAAPDDILPKVLETGHSRFPVIGESRDHVVGLLLAKDLLRLARAGESPPFEMSAILRRAVFVPESKRVNVLLKEFRVSRNHMAVVVDEYGGVAGLVTIEDLLEQIVGDIDDEYDVATGAAILRLENNRFQVQSLTPLAEFNRYFDAEFSDADFDTIGGLVMHTFGHVPKRGETVAIDRFQFNVQSADSRRINQFMVTVLPEAES